MKDAHALRAYKAQWARNEYRRNREKYRTLEYREQRRQQNALRYQGLKISALLMYGACCACCGEQTYEFLAFDHIEGGRSGSSRLPGQLDRGPKAKEPFYRWLLKERREGIRVLCHNCNCARGSFGYCPHERE